MLSAASSSRRGGPRLTLSRFRHSRTEKHKKFAQGRKNHYKIGSLAELRKRAAEMDAEEEDED